MNYQDELKNAIIDEGLLLDKAKEMKNLLAPVATISQQAIKKSPMI